MDTQELISTACPKIGALGGAFYFVPETVGFGKEQLGIDGFRFYFIGRGGVLGDVEAPVVGSAFGYWEPTMVAKMWNSAKEKVAPRDGSRAYLGCAHAFGRQRFAGIEETEAFNAAAEAVVAAANPAGLALFSGYLGEPLPDEPPARAMQLLATLREFRGSAHLAAVVASGIEPRIAHAIRRPEMVKAFGWPEEVPPINDEDHRKLAAADALTDQIVAPAFGALDEAGAKALVAGLQRFEAAVSG
jgi:hypothetical protein